MRKAKAKAESAEGAEGTCVSPRVRASQLTELIIGAAIEVHRATGPGLMESVYEECLCYEFNQRGLQFQRQVELPVAYKGIKLKCGLRMDLVVEDAVVLELKTVDHLLPVHEAQLLTYLKLSGKQIGLLINFNEPTLTRGLKRMVNNFPEPETTHVPSAPSALSKCFSGLTPRLRDSAVKKEASAENAEPETTPVPSAPSALSKCFSSLTPRLRDSAVKKEASAENAEPETTPVPSAPSALSKVLSSLTPRLRASAVKKEAFAKYAEPETTPVPSAPSNCFSSLSRRLSGEHSLSREQLTCSSAS